MAVSYKLKLSITVSGIILGSLFTGKGYGIKQPTSSLNNCAIHITQHEKQRGIPFGLLQAISKVESGRKDATGHLVAWPWTVNAEGQGYYFPTKEAAINAVRKMQFKGIKSIDVGCMQVNLYHHPQAFKSLSHAFDPAKNVAYAAQFLTGLKNEHATWHRAIAHYHSANPMYHIPYQKNVLGMWRRESKMDPIVMAAKTFNIMPKMSPGRRLITAKTLRLKTNKLVSKFHTAAVRKVTRGNTSHIRRASAFKAYTPSRKRVAF